MNELEPTGVVGPLKAGLRIVRGVQRWIEGPDRGSLYRDHYEEWVADLAEALRAHAGDVEALAERLDALEQDRERVLVLGNYGLEAWREAVDRRRAMLGDAALAAVFSELSAAELARVERTIRMLDPEDLQLLYELQGVWEETEAALEAVVLRRDDEGRIIEVKRDEHGRRPDPPRACYEHLVGGHLEGAALLASGCVQPMPSQGVSFAPQNIVQVSALGWLVLRFMGRGRPTGAP